MSVVSKRVVHAGSYVSCKQKTYAPFNNNERVLIKSGTKVYVLHSLDGELYLVKGDDIWPLIYLETKAMSLPKDLKGKFYRCDIATVFFK